VLLGDSNDSAVESVFKDLQVAQEDPIVPFLDAAATCRSRRTKLSLMSLQQSGVT